MTTANSINKTTIQQAIQEFCQVKSISQNDLATQTKVSSATISKMLNGNWNDISETLWRKVWVVVSTGKEMLYATGDHQAISQLCTTARTQRLMVGLVGDTGAGKTTSLKAISRRQNTYYVCFDKTMRAKQFFAAILQEMGIAFEGSLHDMVALIADELNTQPEPLLIIDEAGKLTHNVILFLHVLRDKTMKNAGIVLAGMPYFRENLKRYSNKQKEGYAEFLRRINIWHEMQGLSRQEIQFVCEKHQISDKQEVKEMSRNRRFGDLMNEILLRQISGNED